MLYVDNYYCRNIYIRFRKLLFTINIKKLIKVKSFDIFYTYTILHKKYITYQQSIMVVLLSMEMYMGCTDAEQNVDSLMLICCGILGVMKSICFRIYAGKLTNNYSSALNDYLMIKNARQRAIMRKHASTARVLCCCMLGFSYISCIIYALIPFLDDNMSNDQKNVTNQVLEYPVPSRCALEYFNTPASMYKFLCLFETISLLLTSTTNHGICSLKFFILRNII